MLFWTYFWIVFFFTCRDSPEVTVDARLLKTFGVSDNVNSRGYFQDLMSIEPTVNCSVPQWKTIALEVKTKTINLITTHAQLSAKTLSRSFIKNYDRIPEKHVAQFIVAHLLNLWTRLVATISFFNESVLWSLKDLQSGKVYGSCRTGQIVQTAAVHLTKEGDINKACAYLETTYNQESYRGQQLKADLRDLIRSVEKSEDGVTVLNALIFDETVSLSNLHQAGIIHVVPQHFKQLFIPALLDSFKVKTSLPSHCFQDYDIFLDGLSAEENERLSNVFGLPVTMVKTSLIEIYKAFVIED